MTGDMTNQGKRKDIPKSKTVKGLQVQGGFEGQCERNSMCLGVQGAEPAPGGGNGSGERAQVLGSASEKRTV